MTEGGGRQVGQDRSLTARLTPLVSPVLFIAGLVFAVIAAFFLDRVSVGFAAISVSCFVLEYVLGRDDQPPGGRP